MDSDLFEEIRSILSRFETYTFPKKDRKYDCISSAAYAGDLVELIKMHEKGHKWNRQTTRSAASMGHLDCLRYAHENGCYWHKCVTKVAASNDHYECLRYAHENGCNIHLETALRAGENGHLRCLHYAYENGCKWHGRETYLAAKNGHLECLQYLIEHACPYKLQRLLMIFQTNETTTYNQLETSDWLRRFLFPLVDTYQMNESRNRRLNSVCKNKQDEIRLYQQFALYECKELCAHVVMCVLFEYL